MSDNRCKTCGLEITQLMYRIAYNKEDALDIIKSSRVKTTVLKNNKLTTKYRDLNPCCITVLIAYVDASQYLLKKEKYPIKGGA